MANIAVIHSDQAPAAIGPYSQAVKSANIVYFSGQIPLDPKTMELVEGDIQVKTRRVFDNLRAVAQAAGGDLDKFIKVNISLTDMNDFSQVNEVMREYFSEPYPARACVQVAALPKNTEIEIEAIMSV